MIRFIEDVGSYSMTLVNKHLNTLCFLFFYLFDGGGAEGEGKKNFSRIPTQRRA